MEVVEIPGEDGFRVLKVEVSWKDIAPDYEDIVAAYARRPLRGFRPGNVPRQVVEQRFRREISEQLTRQGAERFCRQALAQDGAEATGPVEVSEVGWEKGGSFRFVARFFPLPEFDLPDYRSWDSEISETDDPQGELSLRLMESVDFPVPDEIVQAELSFEGHTEVEPESEIWQEAARRVKLMLILKRLAREDGIEVEEADVEQRLEMKAVEFGVHVEDLKAELEQGGGRARLKDLLLAENVLAYLLETMPSTKE